MPTGYTADIKDGISFKTYAMNCARAFGACVLLRDEPGGGERIPERFEPSDHHTRQLAERREDLARIEALDAAGREAEAAKAWDKAETYRSVRLDEMRKQRAAYVAMLAQVDAWKPPTTDHVNFRAFMREQITQSIDWDCDESYHSTPTPLQTGDEWAANRIAELHRDIAYHEREHAAEVERAASRTQWVQALRGSLPA